MASSSQTDSQFSEPIQRREQIILGNAVRNFCKVALGASRVIRSEHQTPLGGFPAAESRAIWRRFSQSASVSSRLRPAQRRSNAVFDQFDVVIRHEGNRLRLFTERNNRRLEGRFLRREQTASNDAG